MSSKHTFLKWVRNIHLYLGALITPALLFFAFTGALQTFSLHETTRGSSYKPPAWVATLAQIHKKQNTAVSLKKLQPLPAPAANSATEKPPSSTLVPKPHNALPLKLFFLLVSFGLFISSISGIYMSYRYSRNRAFVTALLVTGTILPPALLFF